MPTPAQIERQIQQETRQIEEGIAKLHADVAKAQSREYASSTFYAQKLLKEALPHVAAQINKLRTQRLLRGSAGKALAPLAKHTMTIPDEVAAMITLKVLFDVCTDPKDNADLANNVIDRVGIALEQEAKWRYFNEQDPDYLKFITLKHHQGKGLHYRDYDTTRRFSEKGIKWDSWPRASRVKVGATFADAALDTTGWWHRHLKRVGRRTNVHILPTQDLLDIVSGLMTKAEAFAPFNQPMLCEPNDWTNEQAGGYYTNEARKGNGLVRTFGPHRLQGETPLNFLNRLQKVAYRINPFILDVANRLEEDEYKVKKAKFLPADHLPLPPKPHDIETNEEARTAYRKEAARVHDYNSTALKRCIRTKMTMSMARRFATEERYYLPWSYDYRGRVYPIPSFLTPQDTCFGKSLIQFAEGEPITERGIYWIKFQLATTYGLDKATMEERQDWASSREAERICRLIADDPIGNISEWEDVDEPFLFLAAAEEYVSVVLEGRRKTTHLPIAVDATCSGLQVLAGLSHDKSTAELVNVFPGERPSDAYKAVANLVNKKLPTEWGFQLTRSDVKRVVMTIPYNAKPFSNRGYIRDALTERKVEITKEQLTEITRLTREAMRKIVPGPLKVMDWLNAEIGKAIKSGKREMIEWTTPSGFNVRQDLRKVKTEQVETHLMGRIRLHMGVELGEPDLNHHKNAGAPNLIHSMDASILHIGLVDFATPFTVIHDSVLCGANHMDDMQKAVRDAYAKIFVEHSPLHDFAEAIDAESDPPMEYTFDPSLVTESDYFFS